MSLCVHRHTLCVLRGRSALFVPCSGASGDDTAPAAPNRGCVASVPLQREWEEDFWGFIGWF